MAIFVEVKRLGSDKFGCTIWNGKSVSLGFAAASTRTLLFETFTDLGPEEIESSILLHE